MLPVGGRRTVAILGATATTYALLEAVRLLVANRLGSAASPQPVASIFYLLSIPASGLLVPAIAALLAPRQREGLSGYLRETGVTLTLLFAVASLVGLCLFRTDAPHPPALVGTIFLITATLPGLGLFLASGRLLGPHPGAAGGALLSLFLVSTLFWIDPWIENSPQELRPGRIERVLHTNPILVASGSLLEDDLLRRKWTYEHSVIGSFYRFEYPEWPGPARTFLLWGATLWLFGLGIALLQRGVNQGRTIPMPPSTSDS